MATQNLKAINITQLALTNTAYINIPLALVNKHELRMSIITEPHFRKR